MRFPLRPALTAAAFAALLFVPAAARAEPSAWTAIGSGALAWRERLTAPNYRVDPTLVFEAGAGLPDRYPVIVGGVFRVSPLVASGTGADMAWLVRACTRGYQVGGFGISLDVGVYARTWREISQGFAGTLSLGAPLGFTLSFNAMAGSAELLAFGGTLSIDLLRLTLYRKTFLNWWPNPEVNTRKLPVASGPFGLHF